MNTQTSNLTTRKHFDLFKKEFKKWQKKFELSYLRIAYFHEKIDGRAEIRYDLDNHTVRLSFDTDWGDSDPINESTICGAAKHEAIHLLLAELSVAGRSKDYTTRDCDIAEEKLVRKLSVIIGGRNE